MRDRPASLLMRGGLILGFAVVVAILGRGSAELSYVVFGLFMGIAAMLLAFVNWRQIVPILFAYVCVEGFVSNWLFPNKLPLLFKDFVIILIYVGFAGEVVLRRRALLNRPFFVPLALFSALALLHVFNPALGSLMVGLVGLKMYIFYLPLILVGYYYFRRQEDVLRFLGYLILLALPVSLMAFYQYAGGWASIERLNPAGFSRAAIETGQMLRVPATFAVAGTFGAYAMVTLLIGAIYWAAMRPSRARLRRSAVLLVLAAALLLSGTRGAFVIFALALTTLSFIRVQQRGAHGFALMIAAWILLAIVLLGTGVRGRLGSLLQKDIYIERLRPPVAGTGEALRENFWGSGCGSATVQARHAGETVFVEQYSLKLAHEMGAPGLFLFTLVVAAFFVEAARVIRRLRTVEGKWLGVGITFFVGLHLLACYVTLSLDTPPIGVYTWFFCGALLRLPEIEAASLAHAAQGVAPLTALVPPGPGPASEEAFPTLPEAPPAGPAARGPFG